MEKVDRKSCTETSTEKQTEKAIKTQRCSGKLTNIDERERKKKDRERKRERENEEEASLVGWLVGTSVILVLIAKTLKSVQ